MLKPVIPRSGQSGYPEFRITGTERRGTVEHAMVGYRIDREAVMLSISAPTPPSHATACRQRRSQKVAGYARTAPMRR
jgi:hypothetical protein